MGHPFGYTDPLRTLFEIDVPIALQAEQFLQTQETCTKSLLDETPALKVLREKMPALHLSGKGRRHLRPGIAYELIPVVTVEEIMDIILALNGQVHPGEQMIILIGSPGAGSFK